MHEKTQAAAHTACHDRDCPSGKRNRFFPKKNLTADDFQLEHDYGIERRRLLNRAVHGWGVVCGFKLELPEGHSELQCGEGLALDSHGRELLRAESGKVPGNRIMRIGDWKATSKQDDGSYLCLLRAHYAERWIDEYRTGKDCGCGAREWNHLCETVVFSVVPLPETVCNCNEANCPRPPCDCPDGYGGMDVRDRGCGALPLIDRGPHDCLCQWVRDRQVPAPPDKLGCWKGFEGYWIAVDAPVPLACVNATIDDCGYLRFELIKDACTPRRLVKNNDLLFDLFRGCDLTHIDNTGWAAWHRHLDQDSMMLWDTFVHMFPHQGGQNDMRDAVDTGFWIGFSAPVDIRTLTPDCVRMTVLAPEDEGGWVEVRRVPIPRLKPESEGRSTQQVSICVDRGWCEDEVWGHRSIFYRHHVMVEIEVRGDLILDCHGQSVDANAVGLRAVPTGNGTPGGTYVSSFRVGHRPHHKHESQGTE